MALSDRRIKALLEAATTGSVARIESALGHFEGDAAIAAAKRAAAAALAASRWESLAYLADFLADTTITHAGSDSEQDGLGPFIVAAHRDDDADGGESQGGEGDGGESQGGDKDEGDKDEGDESQSDDKDDGDESQGVGKLGMYVRDVRGSKGAS